MMSERKWRVLYLEDQQEMIDLIALATKDRPVEIIGANTVQEAIEILHRDPPDLVLLDLMIPGADGWDVQREMMKDPKLREVPIIVITARARLEEKRKGLSMPGVIDYIVKPFGPSRLLTTIDRVLEELAAREKTSERSHS